MAAPKLSEDDGIARHDHMVQLHGMSWADYERLLEVRGDQSGPRYTYLQGELEIMSPSKSHESIKSILGCLVEIWCLEKDIEFLTAGSWTLKDEGTRRGIEPDECYLFAENALADGPPAPDLAIEVIWTSGTLDKLDVYRKLGVAEVWVWSRGRIVAHVLEGENYSATTESRVLPGIRLRDLEALVDSKTTSQAMRAYRALLQGRS